MTEKVPDSVFSHVPTEELGQVRTLDVMALLQGVCARLDAHLDECFRRFSPAVHRFLRTLALDDAEDLVTDVFMGLPTTARSFVPVPGAPEEEVAQHFERWLLRVAHNRWRTHNRSLGRKPKHVTIDGAEVIASTRTSITAKLVKREAIDHALRGMPSGPREAWALHSEGFGAKEIGEILGIDAGAAAVRVHRAREYMKQRLQQTKGE